MKATPAARPAPAGNVRAPRPARSGAAARYSSTMPGFFPAIYYFPARNPCTTAAAVRPRGCSAACDPAKSIGCETVRHGPDLRPVQGKKRQGSREFMIRSSRETHAARAGGHVSAMMTATRALHQEQGTQANTTIFNNISVFRILPNF